MDPTWKRRGARYRLLLLLLLLLQDDDDYCFRNPDHPQRSSPRMIHLSSSAADSNPLPSVSSVALSMAAARCGWDHRFLRLDRRRNRKKMRHGASLLPLLDSPTLCCQVTRNHCCWRHPSDDLNLELLRISREKFIQEISFRSKDKDVSLAKALLHVAAEDEAFMAFNQDRDAHSIMNERKDAPVQFEAQLGSCGVEEISLAGKSISGWLNELDILAKEVEAELVSRDIGCHLVEVLEAVNIVLFDSRGFKRYPVLVDPNFSYLHAVLSSRCGSAIMLSVIYIEICQRLGVSMVGSCVGEDFLIWPQTGNPEELFKASSGHSFFAIVNGRCVEDPRSKASDLNSKSLLGLDIATNRDIIGIALANLIRLHWKRASRTNHGLMLTSPLRPVYAGNDKASMVESSKVLLLRPQDLRLAIMASERLLILQPHNWALRRDHGMLLYYNRRYGEAVQELSICMAFAPAEEAEVLEPFVEKLHLLRLESSWKPLEQLGSVAVP